MPLRAVWLVCGFVFLPLYLWGPIVEAAAARHLPPLQSRASSRAWCDLFTRSGIVERKERPRAADWSW